MSLFANTEVNLVTCPLIACGEVAEALRLVLQRHKGLRRDGVTPEACHPIAVALIVNEYTLPDRRLAFQVALLHDIVEDCDFPVDALRKRFGKAVSERVWTLSKVCCGQKTRSSRAYWNGIGQDPLCTIVKGADRLHNLHTMRGVFSAEAQKRYLENTHDWLMPLLTSLKDQIWPWSETAGRLERSLRRVMEQVSSELEDVNAYKT